MSKCQILRYFQKQGIIKIFSRSKKGKTTDEYYLKLLTSSKELKRLGKMTKRNSHYLLLLLFITFMSRLVAEAL